MRGFLVGFVVLEIFVGLFILRDFFFGFSVGVFLGLIVCGLHMDCLTGVCFGALDGVF